MSRAQSIWPALAAGIGLWLATPAWGQPISGPDPELAGIKTELEFGHFRQVVQSADERIDRGGLTEGELAQLHEYAGIAAFNVNQRDQAERHFQALLRVDPDHSLDPFSTPPPAIAFFNHIREVMTAERSQRREERRLRAQRLKQEEEARALAEREAQLERQRFEDLSRRTLTRVDHHSYILNFIPFGAGQFDEGRPGAGSAFAVTEGLLASASVAAFWIYQLQYLTVVDQIVPNTAPPNTLRITGVPAAQYSQAMFFSKVKLWSGVGFYAVYVGGVIEALLHYRAETITTVVQDPSAVPAVPPPLLTKPRADLFLMPGGAAVGLSAHF